MSTYSNQLQPALQNYYNVLFSSFTRDRRGQHIYLRTYTVDENHS